MYNSRLFIIFFVLFFNVCVKAQDSPGYAASWNSLRQHDTPTWLMDAKFGIYCHWGIWTIRYAEGYDRGDDKSELDDAIAKFTAKNFDAAEWAELFKKAGAKFAGPVGWHGSDYLHWDTQLTKYNSVYKSPHIDIVGEVAREARKAGLKTFVSLHHKINQEGWINFAKEVIDKYEPDIFWVDAGFGGTKAAHHKKIVNRSKFIGEGNKLITTLKDKLQREFLAYYYNHALKNNKEVEFVYKSYDIPPGVGMRDLENGMLDNIAYDIWMTDIDMNICPDWKTHGWFYREGIPLRDANNIIDILVDVVSKNGILLLNVPPFADGSFSLEIQNTLREVGNWLDKNGEAIYGTSPWVIYGEGPTNIKTGNYTYHHNEHFGVHHFTKQDIRFTIKDNNLYAICLGVPDKSLNIKSLNTTFKLFEGDIKSVSLLGENYQLNWEHSQEGLKITLPNTLNSPYALTFKIELN